MSVKVERGSTFRLTRGVSYIASISFTHINFTCIRTEKLRDSGNKPQVTRPKPLHLGRVLHCTAYKKRNVLF